MTADHLSQCRPRIGDGASFVASAKVVERALQIALDIAHGVLHYPVERLPVEPYTRGHQTARVMVVSG